MNKRLVDIILIFGIIFLFFFSSIIPIVIGNTIDNKVEDEYAEKITHDIYDKYVLLDSKEYMNPFQNERFDVIESDEIIPFSKSTQTVSNDGLMDSAWPMYCHDTHHTGRSPYNTADNPFNEKWRFLTEGWADGSPVIDEDGIIFIGAKDLYAIYQNGTIKWKYDTPFRIESAPALDENGIIYIGTIWAMPNYLYAIYTSNGTLKWKYETGNDIYSSPVIGEDGAIYFGDASNYINAIWPNGTLKWRYQTGNSVLSSPAIGDDGTVYCGSHDGNLYALYFSNGTAKWTFSTGGWIRTAPCIADDGTIYIVSLDDYLYAINPNGTEKWKTSGCAGTSPTIAQDGTIYVGYNHLKAIYPNNGTVKWIFNPGSNRRIRGGTPCNSIDGTIFFGTNIGEIDGGEIIAVNQDGTEQWRKTIANLWVESAPAIAEDGTIYIGSSSDDAGESYGYLYALGRDDLEADAHGPYFGIINNPVQFTGSADGGYPPYSYHWDFGDDETSEEQNPTHEYDTVGNYTITLTVTDDNESIAVDTTWALIRESNDPPNKPTITGETQGYIGETYEYTFTTTDPDDDDIWFYIEWGDDSNSGWIGPYNSCDIVTKSHTWDEEGTYTIRAKAKDLFDDESDWGTLEVTMPLNQQVSQETPLFGWFLQRFPNAFSIFRELFNM